MLVLENPLCYLAVLQLSAGEVFEATTKNMALSHLSPVNLPTELGTNLRQVCWHDMAGVDARNLRVFVYNRSNLCFS